MKNVRRLEAALMESKGGMSNISVGQLRIIFFWELHMSRLYNMLGLLSSVQPPHHFFHMEVSIIEALFFPLSVREEDENADRCHPPPVREHRVSTRETLTISPSFSGPPGQHMEPSKLAFNFPAAVVKSAALTAALRELIRNPRA